MLPRSRGSSSRTTGSGSRVGEHRGGIDRAALGQRDHAGGWRQRRELGKDGGLDRTREREQARAQIGGEERREALELDRVRGDHLEQRSVEAEGVLERVEPFEHGERGVAPRTAKARDQRAVGHARDDRSSAGASTESIRGRRIAELHSTTPGALTRRAIDGARGTRTPDLLGAIQALSQLSYSPVRPRRGGGTRLWKCSRRSRAASAVWFGGAMGLLDDAIREHMDLKRLRGADPSEVAREEQDVLGPVHLQEQAEPQAPEEDPADEKEIAPAAQDFANVGQETAELDMRTVLQDEQSRRGGLPSAWAGA